VEKVNWTDGTVLTVSIAPLGGGVARIGSAQVDLSDDRSFLSEIHPGQPPGQGWIRAGIGGASSELHVLLRRLPPGTDLVLGRRAMELLAAAVDGGASN